MKHTFTSLVKETINHYHSGNRSATASGMCSYLSNDGRMCAVGRCLKPEYLEIFHKIEFGTLNMGHGTAIDEIFEAPALEGLKISDVVKDEYSDITLEEWRKVQRLHDDDKNWDANGLSKNGHNALRVICM